jgi:hypothetical protein
MYPKKDTTGCLIFPDYPEFKPNRTPKEVFQAGAFRGTYFRPIYSSVTGKSYKNIHHGYTFLKGIPENIISLPMDRADTSISKYDKKVGTTLEFWESKGWIMPQNPYGWFHWYCDFYSGIRSPDDDRQINRWKAFTGPTGRFRNSLINKITKAEAKWDDYTISPAIRQSCLHWGYELTKKDYDFGVARNKK